MTKEELISQADRIIKSTNNNPIGSLVQAKQFLKTYAGYNNQFFLSLEEIKSKAFSDVLIYKIKNVLKSFIEYVDNDLLRGISLEREIQVETVSDYLEQAELLLNDNKVHPAAATIIIGASLEEFLRNWIEEDNIDITHINKNIDSYAKELLRLEKIKKQDIKDITSWGGKRNDAAHGHWENVENRQQIKLMLEGVNLFIRKYSKTSIL